MINMAYSKAMGKAGMQLLISISFEHSGHKYVEMKTLTFPDTVGKAKRQSN